MLVILNCPHATCLPDLKLLHRILPDLFSTSSNIITINLLLIFIVPTYA